MKKVLVAVPSRGFADALVSSYRGHADVALVEEPEPGLSAGFEVFRRVVLEEWERVEDSEAAAWGAFMEIVEAMQEVSR